MRYFLTPYIFSPYIECFPFSETGECMYLQRSDYILRAYLSFALTMSDVLLLHFFCRFRRNPIKQSGLITLISFWKYLYSCSHLSNGTNSVSSSSLIRVTPFKLMVQ